MIFFVGISGGIGAVVRFACSKLNKNQEFPIGTFLVNIVGSFLIGILFVRYNTQPLYQLLGVGFCGGLTTYSTFMFEWVQFKKEGKEKMAKIYFLASILTGFIATLIAVIIANL